LQSECALPCSITIDLATCKSHDFDAAENAPMADSAMIERATCGGQTAIFGWFQSANHSQDSAGSRKKRRFTESRPAYGRIKAARCGPVGRLKKVGTSGPWHDVHFETQPAFFQNRNKISVRRTSHSKPSCARPTDASPMSRHTSHDRLDHRCRTTAGPSRLALRAPGSAGSRP
jgi:hypothetical protein